MRNGLFFFNFIMKILYNGGYVLRCKINKNAKQIQLEHLENKIFENHKYKRIWKLKRSAHKCKSFSVKKH